MKSDGFEDIDFYAFEVEKLISIATISWVFILIVPIIFLYITFNSQ